MNAIRDWIRANALPLSTVEAGNGFVDLEPFGKVIGDARIVSLGEATHGTREFFQLKHRLLEYCVSKLGFTIFGIEASFPECLRINDYVLHGLGDPAVALTGQRFWTWDTEEVLELIEWMHRWNRTNARKVKFYGFDMQFPAEASLAVIDYLRQVAPEMAATCEKELWPLSSDFAAERFVLLPQPVRDRTFASIKGVLSAFDREQPAWIAKTGDLSWKLARLNAVVLSQFRADTNRDVAMANNVAALLDMEGPDTKAVLWAHNGHAARESDYVEADKTRIPNMGSRLHELFGPEQLVVGFAFNQGSFQAVQYGKGLIDHAVGPADEGSLDHGLASADIPTFLLDLATAPTSGPVNDWLASRPKSRWIGAVYSEDRAKDLMVLNDPRRAYDALAFVERTTAALPMTAGKQSAHAEKRQVNPEPFNLALGGSRPLPDGWHPLVASRRFEHSIALLDDEKSPAGNRILSITRDSAPWRWGDGRLAQTFAAEPWRGKRLRFSANVRAEAQGLESGTQLYIEVRPEVAEDMIWCSPPAHVVILEGSVRSPQWQRFAVEIDVLDTAHSITIGMAFSGNGRGLFADLTLDAGAVLGFRDLDLDLVEPPILTPDQDE